MSAQVSYKNQFLLMFMLLLTFLAVVELFVNIWLNYFYRCNFEENEMFQDIDENAKREICLDNLGIDILEQNVTMVKKIYNNPIYINDEKFRGPDFSIEKPENTFRIFAVGGSTTFGAGVLDNQTWPFYLQKFYDKTNLGLDVEVINVGKTKWGSIHESNFVKEHLVNFEPDLFIIYDGWNDMAQWLKGERSGASPTEWREIWMEVCELGKQYRYETAITLQPIIFTGKKIMTEQELENYNWVLKGNLPENYPLYFEQLQILESHCSRIADLRNIFDDIYEPIFWDRVHVGSLGNEIIAEHMYKLSLPLVKDKATEKFSNVDMEAFSNEKIIVTSSEYSESFLDESYNVIKDIIFQYKTPRISTLIFEQ